MAPKTDNSKAISTLMKYHNFFLSQIEVLA